MHEVGLTREILDLTYEGFISILYSLHGPQLEREFRLESRLSRNRILDRMVFGSELNFNNGRYIGGGNTEGGGNGNDNGDGGGDENQENSGGGENLGSRIQALRAASCIKVLGKGVIRVVKRVDAARENNKLDLSHCQLVQVPDAVYYMMRNTPLVACDLSSNVITKIPPKLTVKFSFIKRLDVSHNRMSTLPAEVSSLTQLERVDISHNSFVSLPECLFQAPKLQEIDARKNFIAGLDIELVASSPKLETLNLEENPLTREAEAAAKSEAGIEIRVTKRELEDWEDLNI